MNKKELISAVAKETEETKRLTEKMIEATLKCIKETLVKGENVKLVGDFLLEIKVVPEHKGRDPQKNIEIMIPAKNKIKFTPSKPWKKAVNGVVDEE